MNKLPDIDYAEYLKTISFAEGASLRPCDDFCDDIHELASHGEKIQGDIFPWEHINSCIKLGKGKLSIWAGTNGSGKSLLLGQVMMSVMTNNLRRIAIASLEMQPKQTLYRMICQSYGRKATGDESTGWLQTVGNRLWIYDELDRVEIDRILGMAHYAAHELKCDHIVIDSLTKCGLGRDDYDRQAKFVDRLQWCAKHWGVHIHLVCHMRKASSETHKDNKNDIRGAAEITDLADNVFIVRRNRAKEEALNDPNTPPRLRNELMEKPDCALDVAKNRDYGEEKSFGLWMCKKSGRYYERQTDIMEF